jgi:hypothetical protein
LSETGRTPARADADAWRAISWLPGIYAICRLDPTAAIPEPSGPLFSASRTTQELSIVCRDDAVPMGAAVETGWRVMKVEGPIPFGTTGVLASLATPLAQAGVSVFAVSTFDTDYLLVRERDSARACAALELAGFTFGGGP